MIENGRHQNIDKNLRFCPFCPTRIEDEMHFLLECECYAIHRKELFNTINEKVKDNNIQLRNKKRKIYKPIDQNTYYPPHSTISS